MGWGGAHPPIFSLHRATREAAATRYPRVFGVLERSSRREKQQQRDYITESNINQRTKQYK